MAEVGCPTENKSVDPSQPESSAPKEEEDPNQFFATRVSLKSWHKFLSAHVIGGVNIACLCEGHSIIIYLYIGGLLSCCKYRT